MVLTFDVDVDFERSIGRAVSHGGPDDRRLPRWSDHRGCGQWEAVMVPHSLTRRPTMATAVKTRTTRKAQLAVSDAIFTRSVPLASPPVATKAS